MDMIHAMLKGELKVASLGLKSFTAALEAQCVKVVHIDWKPPAGGDPELLKLIDQLAEPALAARIKAANDEGCRRLMAAQPVLTGLAPARDVIPALAGGKKLLLHAGPPVTWENMCGPVRGAVIGACLYEEWAPNLKAAEELAASGEVGFSPCHHHDAVGPMAGIISPSMWVFQVRNAAAGNVAYATMNEGLGKVLRFGAYGREVITRLRWMQKVLGPALAEALKLAPEGINLKGIIAQALQMGDECHNRNNAATSLFLRALTPFLLQSKASKKTIAKVFEFIEKNNHFFLNLSMAAGKATVEPLRGLADSTLMLFMARNGTEIGMQVAALPGQWFTAPAGHPRGLYFPGFTEKDANPDLGDSTITESSAIGGFAMATAPAIVKFIGGSPADAIKYTREMYEITWTRHRDFQMPNLNFAGTPCGVDLVKVNQTGITPIINTGIAARKPGIGQVGAGILYAPPELFRAALKAFAAKYGGTV